MNASVQNYLKVITSLAISQPGDTVKVSDIAKKLDVSAAAVTEMIKKLEKQGFVKNVPYKGALLSEKGRQAGLNMIRHHRLWETHLVQVLHLPWDKVHEEAERLEHACSDYLIDIIDEHLGHPQFDPHGNPIPQQDGTLPDCMDAKPLADCTVGDAVVVTRVVDMGTQFLKYLDDVGIRLQQTVRVESQLDFDQSLVCDVSGQKVSVSHQAAERIFVVPIGTQS